MRAISSEAHISKQIWEGSESKREKKKSKAKGSFLVLSSNLFLTLGLPANSDEPLCDWNLKACDFQRTADASEFFYGKIKANRYLLRSQ